ncbi:uncharacterized protein [Rutidosis leptorrhynchoides]|uniref:uncharacterized protein n=1 Tax=Rutidosis leptorrhynchoides TaxID=125765 RepID=UPI003A990F93
MDLCGPMCVSNLGGRKYILVIVDDYSRYTWVRFLKSKSETPKIIIEFLKRIQLSTNKLVQILRTNNGLEFQNSVLNSYLDQAGITHQTSATRTPQQNGVVERRNCTLVEAARTMLVYSKLPLSLWAEAVNTACFTQNRSIINRRFDKTPYELLLNRRPNVKYFHIFGCVCYVLNDEDSLGKFVVCGDEVIFIGYSQDLDSSNPAVVGESPSDESNSSDFLLLDDLDTGVSSSNNAPIANSHPPAIESPPLNSSKDSPSNETDTRILDATTPPVLPTDQNADTLIPLWEENATYPTNNIEPTGSSSSSYINTSLDDGSTSPLPHTTKWTVDHPIHQIIGDPDAPIRTRKASNNECLFAAFLSTIEPKTTYEALQDPDWSIAMQEEIHQFDRLEVWEPVPRSSGKTIIDTKWIFKNKKDPHGIIIRTSCSKRIQTTRKN